MLNISKGNINPEVYFEIRVTWEIRKGLHNNQLVRLFFEVMKEAFAAFSVVMQVLFIILFEALHRGHSFSTYAKFSEKLTFLTPWYEHARNFDFSENFASALNE